MKKQLLIEFRSSWNERERISRRKIKKQIQKYSGTAEVCREANSVRVMAVLQER